MVPIYICDDNRQFLDRLNEVINRIILINQFDMQVVKATDSPEELLDERERNAGRSIYFLDIDLKNEVHNGFTLANPCFLFRSMICSSSSIKWYQ